MKRTLLSLALFLSAGAVWAQSPAPSAGQLPADVAKPMSMEDEVAKTRSEMADDDTDKNGKISEKEFLSRHSEAFKRMDLDKDGNLTPEEFVQYRRQLIEANKRRMENMQKSMQQ